MWLGGTVLALAAAWQGVSLRPSWSMLGWALAAGAFFAGDLYSWHRAILHVGAGMATILANTQVFWVAIFGALVLRERLSPRLVIAIPVAVVGIALLSGFVFVYFEVLGGTVPGSPDLQSMPSAQPFDPIGVVLGLATGLFYSGYLLTLRRAQKLTHRPVNALAYMVWVCFAGAALLGLAALSEGHPLVPPDARTWWLLVGLAVVAQGAGWWVLATNLPYVPASRTGLIILLQPTLATVWGAILFHEVLGRMQLAGAALTLLAISFGATATAAAATPARDPDPIPTVPDLV